MFFRPVFAACLVESLPAELSFGPELSLLPAKVVSSATPAPVSVGRVPRATCATYLEEEPVALGELLLHHISYWRRNDLSKSSPLPQYMTAVDWPRIGAIPMDDGGFRW